ncbi:hypothetical protein BU17DRAFT_97076 [Hysterangium stoloniferum]|nr:hypothetical protein BU17DRAFT_97076 [Hysterangium stoloniferum]
MSGDFYFNTSTYPFLSDGDLAGELNHSQLSALRVSETRTNSNNSETSMSEILFADPQTYRFITKEDTTLRLHVEIADWGEIRTTLLNTSGVCRHSDGEMQNTTPRQIIIEDLERNSAFMVPPVKSTMAEELDALSSLNLFLTAQPAPPSLSSTLARTPQSGTLGNFCRPYSRCFDPG